jgi:hypothetical protein
MRKLFILSVSVLILINSFAQRPQGDYSRENLPGEGIITGKVQDQVSETFVEYATVGIYRHRDSTLITGSITDKDGIFVLKDLP